MLTVNALVPLSLKVRNGADHADILGQNRISVFHKSSISLWLGAMFHDV